MVGGVRLPNKLSLRFFNGLPAWLRSLSRSGRGESCVAGSGADGFSARGVMIVIEGQRKGSEELNYCLRWPIDGCSGD